MKIINEGLSPALHDAIVRYNAQYSRTGYLSTTSCLNPPRKNILEKRHGDNIVITSSSLIDSFIGGSCHAAVDGAHPEGIHEKEFVTEICGVLFSGRPDIIVGDSIGDWKFTKVWSYIYSGGMKDEWHWQGNINSWLARLGGFKVGWSWFELVFLDWSREEARRNGDYPQSRVLRVSPEPISDEEVRKFVTERVELHLAAEELPDDRLPRCTPKEQWARPDVFAVMREGQKRAVKLYDLEIDAKKAAHGQPGLSVVHRPGKRVRCETYCPASQVCNQYKEEASDAA